ncbi:hypothetical protein Tco_0661907 [Tanacetum coccineum]
MTSRWRNYHIPAESVKATYLFSKFKDTFNDLNQNLKTVLNFKDILPQALINKKFLKEHHVYGYKEIKSQVFQSRSSQDVLKAKRPRYQVKAIRYQDQDPKSQACKRNFKRIPKKTRLQDSRRHK